MPLLEGTIAILNDEGGSFNVLFTPQSGAGGPEKAHYVANADALEHFMTVIGCPMSQQQVQDARADRKIAPFGLRAIERDIYDKYF